MGRAGQVGRMGVMGRRTGGKGWTGGTSWMGWTFIGMKGASGVLPAKTKCVAEYQTKITGNTVPALPKD